MTETQQDDGTAHGFDPAADFLLDLSFDQLFEPASAAAGVMGEYRCKGCRLVVKGSDRKKHYARHLKNRTATKKESNMTDKATKPAKTTAKDLGVPAAYLAENGNFRPGMDARLKSDLILAILEIDNKKALVKWTKTDAEKLFAKYPHWQGFLERKREILTAAAAKVAAKAEERKQRESEKAAAKRAGSTGKANGKNVSLEETVAKEQADFDAKEQAKPDPKPVSTKKPSSRKPASRKVSKRK